MPRLTRLIALTPQECHATDEPPSAAASEPRHACLVDAFRACPTPRHPTGAFRRADAVPLLGVPVNAALRQKPYALVMRHKELTRLRQTVKSEAGPLEAQTRALGLPVKRPCLFPLAFPSNVTLKGLRPQTRRGAAVKPR